MQETMLKALDNKDKFDPGTNFKGWMYIIMRNAFINNYRIKKSQGDLYILSEPDYLNPEKPDVPLNKNDAFQKVQKRRVQEKR